MINRIIIDTPYPPPRQVFSPGLATTEAQVHTTHILDSALETLIEHCLLINKNLLEICLFNVKLLRSYLRGARQMSRGVGCGWTDDIDDTQTQTIPGP